MVIAHIMSAAGLLLLTVLPEVMPPFAGILISVMVYAIGGGLLEVLVSPVVESCPSDNKEKAMSMLHSFYCWGAGILISVMVYAIGGGLLEVLVSPVVESCPSDNKEKAMSMLHSFYCWGHVGVVLLSTLFFQVAGIENWKLLAAVWAVVPLVNAFAFTKVPMASLMEEGETGIGIKKLFGWH